MLAMIGQMAGGMGKQNEKENKAQQEFTELLTKEMMSNLSDVINDGKDLTFEFDIDKKIAEHADGFDL